MSYASDLDDLHKSQQTRDLGLVPTRYSYMVHKGKEPCSTVLERGIVTKDLYLGKHKMRVQELELRV